MRAFEKALEMLCVLITWAIYAAAAALRILCDGILRGRETAGGAGQVRSHYGLEGKPGSSWTGGDAGFSQARAGEIVGAATNGPGRSAAMTRAARVEENELAAVQAAPRRTGRKSAKRRERSMGRIMAGVTAMAVVLAVVGIGVHELAQAAWGAVGGGLAAGAAVTLTAGAVGLGMSLGARLARMRREGRPSPTRGTPGAAAAKARREAAGGRHLVAVASGRTE